MIAVSKEESLLIRDRFPNVKIIRTMKQRSKRHKYYCEEAREVMRFINSIRIDSYEYDPRRGGRHKSRKRTR